MRKPYLLLLLIFFIWSISFAQDGFYEKLALAGTSLSKIEVVYDPAYFSIPYPNGDIPKEKGVCTDVIIRAYRKLGIDLQQKVHKDMKTHFSDYPNIWGLQKPDTNIDHRRVPNLMVFFERFGKILPITRNAQDYAPGDIVCWRLSGGATHIGLVTHLKNDAATQNLIVHNIGAGQVLQDCLFDYTIIGHYRYGGD